MWLTWLPEAYMRSIFKVNKQKLHTDTHRNANSLQCFLNEPRSADVIIKQQIHTHTHPSLVRQERNTQVVSIIYLKSPFPCRHSSSSPEEDQKYTYRTGWRVSGEQQGHGNRQTNDRTPELFSSHCYRAVFLC